MNRSELVSRLRGALDVVNQTARGTHQREEALSALQQLSQDVQRSDRLPDAIGGDLREAIGALGREDGLPPAQARIIAALERVGSEGSTQR